MSATTFPPARLSPQRSAARLVVRIDAIFEAILGACCAALAVGSPRAGAWRLPGYLTPAVVSAVALGLLAVGVVLWRLSGRTTRQLLVALGAGNAVTALAILWYGVAVDGGSAVSLLLIGAALLLACLAVVQALLARRAPGRPPVHDEV